MIETQNSPELDLIDEDEFNKRLEEANKKNQDIVIELLQVLAENKVSWGTVVERNAVKYADRIAVKFENLSWTYAEFNERVNQYANYFLSLGMKKGDDIEVLMTNRPEYLLVFTAIGKIGAVGSLINPDLRESSLEYGLKLIPGKYIIVGENCLEPFISIKTSLKLPKETALLYSSDQGLIEPPEGFIDLSQKVKNQNRDNPSTTSEIKGSDPLGYIFTSGTTGLPKASIFIHSRMVGSGYYIGQIVGELTSDDTMYVPLPLFHTTALCLGWAAAFGAGTALALSRRFSVSRFWGEIRKFNATAFNYVGEMCRYLINQPPSPDDLNNSVKTIIGNGLRPDIWMDFKKRFNITRVGEFYGASEIGLVFANYLNFDCTVGYSANPYAIVKYNFDEEAPVKNEDGFMEKVELGGTGLLLWEIAAENIFVGYTSKEATEKKIFRNVFEKGDRWFNSGDLMRDQGCNHVQFVDRIGDTYRWKAHNVSTSEVEEVINVFDDVLMSTAYGVKIPGTDGRAGMASIVIQSKLDDFNIEKLADHLKNNLPLYAIPLFLRFKPKLSITSTLKFRKVDLKKEGFNIETIDDPIYTMLVGKDSYIKLTNKIYDKIRNRDLKF